MRAQHLGGGNLPEGRQPLSAWLFSWGCSRLVVFRVGSPWSSIPPSRSECRWAISRALRSVDTYFWPGVFLLSIAAASIVTVSGLAFGWRWQWAARVESSMGHTWPWLGAVAIGGVLLVFEIIELFLIPFHPIMHPLLIGVSLAIIGLALTTSSLRYLSPRAVNA